MQRVKEKAIQLLQDQIVDRVIGWRAGEFFYDLTPSVFTSVEDIEKNFVWSVFSGANLSKYLIVESRKGGKAAVFLKPCDSYSFVQLLKEHRILRETVYAVGVQCGGMCGYQGAGLCRCHSSDGGWRSSLRFHDLRRGNDQKGRCAAAQVQDLQE